MTVKRKITICSGTACYVMGGAQLIMLGDIIPADLKDSVEICGATCLKTCQDGSGRKPPFVKIDDEIISEASVAKIIDYLRAAK